MSLIQDFVAGIASSRQTFKAQETTEAAYGKKSLKNTRIYETVKNVKEGNHCRPKAESWKEKGRESRFCCRNRRWDWRWQVDDGQEACCRPAMGCAFRQFKTPCMRTWTWQKILPGGPLSCWPGNSGERECGPVRSFWTCWTLSPWMSPRWASTCWTKQQSKQWTNKGQPGLSRQRSMPPGPSKWSLHFWQQRAHLHQLRPQEQKGEHWLYCGGPELVPRDFQKRPMMVAGHWFFHLGQWCGPHRHRGEGVDGSRDLQGHWTPPSLSRQT